MIFEIDMGNTRLKWRVLDQQMTLAQGVMSIEVPFDRLVDKIVLYRSAINAVVVASVVGDSLEQKLTDWSTEYLKLQPIFVRSDAICGRVRNSYREPKMLGVDRWLGILAAFRLTTSACIVVSCGTAITVDLVARNGDHLGGFIAPGLNLMLDSLASRTRQIKLDGVIPTLSLLPATETSAAVYSACAAMTKGLIDNGVQQLHSLDQNNEFKMIFTGGDAGRFLPFYRGALLIPDLVLDGLACVLDYPQQLE